MALSVHQIIEDWRVERANDEGIRRNGTARATRHTPEAALGYLRDSLFDLYRQMPAIFNDWNAASAIEALRLTSESLPLADLHAPKIKSMMYKYSEGVDQEGASPLIALRQEAAGQ